MEQCEYCLEYDCVCDKSASEITKEALAQAQSRTQRDEDRSGQWSKFVQQFHYGQVAYERENEQDW